MTLKLIIFSIIIALPIIIYWISIKNKLNIDKRLLASYFIFGSWFGMCGEIFLITLNYKILDGPIPFWEYRILPIHNKATSSFGPIMWGIASVGVGFFQHYKINEITYRKFSKWKLFLIESSFLMIAEIYFNISGYFFFNEYFFYYFSSELYHFSTFYTIPFWWCGYKIIVKASDLLYKQEKLNLSIAILMIVILLWGI